jgi:hypothetical protein
MLGTVACHAWFSVDGTYHARWVDRPVIEGRPRWRYHTYVVYEVDGAYYREYQGRWIVYRDRPRELVVYQ